MKLGGLFIGILLVCMAILNVNSISFLGKADNLAGDLDQLPENEMMFDLSNGVYDYNIYGQLYRKGNIFITGIETNPAQQIYQPPEQLFDGTHASAGIPSNNPIMVHFPNIFKITRVRVYPMDQTDFKCDSVEVSTPWWPLNESDTDQIFDKSDFLEFRYSNLITDTIIIKPYYHLGDCYFNEIEIYYDPFFNPYYYTSQVNNTNITNEYYNETNVLYENNTYVNNTYLNHTYENSTTQNVTYLNVTNQTTEKEFFNTTKEYFNNTYFNETVLADNQRLEDKINDLWKQLNETEDVDIRKSNSLADDTYTDPILLILLLIVIVFQIIIFLRSRRKEEPPIEEDDNTEAEIEYTPSRGFSKEAEVDIIARKVQEERTYQEETAPPARSSTSYQHKNNDSSMSQTPAEVQRPEINVTLPSQSPPGPPPAPPQSFEQKALPEHGTP